MQYLIDLQARDREREMGDGGGGEREKGCHDLLTSSKDLRFTPTGWQLRPLSIVLAIGYIGSLHDIVVVIVLVVYTSCMHACR